MSERTPGAMQVCEKCGDRWDAVFEGCLYQVKIPNKEWARKHCPIEQAIEAEYAEATGAHEVEYGHAEADAASHDHWKRT